MNCPSKVSVPSTWPWPVSCHQGFSNNGCFKPSSDKVSRKVLMAPPGTEC